MASCFTRVALSAPHAFSEKIHAAKDTTGQAVQAAIDTCAAQGGGVAYLPPGRYVSGPLYLKDNIELRLEAGATVVLRPVRADWPTGARALINASKAKRIAITGRGTFDGNAQWEYAPVRGQDPEIAQGQENARLAGVEVEWDGEKPESKWGSAPVIQDVSNFVLDDFRGQAARPDGPLPAVQKENVTDRLVR